MNWKTIYITGREGFAEELKKALQRSDLDFMPGYDSGDATGAHELYWIPEQVTVRELKEAIGSRLVFRYRLRFFDSLEQFIETMHSSELTEEELRKINEMRLMA